MVSGIRHRAVILCVLLFGAFLAAPCALPAQGKTGESRAGWPHLKYAISFTYGEDNDYVALTLLSFEIAIVQSPETKGSR